MRKNIIGTLVCVAGLASQLGCSAEQPAPQCFVQRSGPSRFAVRYVKVGAPEGTGTGCDTLPTETWGLERYQNEDGRYQLAFKPNLQRLRNYDTAQKKTATTETVGTNPWASAFKASLVRTIGSMDALAIGNLPENDRPDANNICSVTGGMMLVGPMTDLKGPTGDQSNFTSKTDAEGNTTWSLNSGVAKDTVYGPAGSATYTMENVQVYEEARSAGQTFTADLTYKEDINGQTCTQKYKAVGLWPAIGCSDDIDCDPCADPYNTDRPRFSGSGINPDLNVKCDTTVGMCVLADDNLPGFLDDATIAAKQKACEERNKPPAQ